MTQDLRILIVDDERANLDLLERALTREGHRCMRAATGEEAVALYAQEPPDLVLMDVMLPGIDGFEATRRLRRQKTSRWIPVIFLSALNQAVDIVTGLDAGGDDYLTKPIDLSVLRSKIDASQRFVELHRQIEDQSRQLRRYYDDSEAEKRLATDMMVHLRRENKPAIPDVDAKTVAAIDVAGDIIAVEETPDGRLHLMLADATGHGLVAAINLLPAVETFYGMTAQGHAMPRIINRINAMLRELIPGNRFVCALFASFDPMLGTIEVWNAGVPGALLTDKNGTLLRRFESKIVPLGIIVLEAEDLVGEIDAMAAEQVLVACSDGLVEAENAAGEAFGAHGLVAALPQVLRGDGCRSLLEHLRRHTGSTVYADDVSVCIVRQSPPPRVLGGRHKAGWQAPTRHPQDISFGMVFGPDQLRRLVDVTPRFMNLARSHFGLTPVTFSRIYRIVRQLTSNAVDWGLLRLAPENPSVSAELRRQQRSKALAGLSAGRLAVSIHACLDDAGQRAWEISIEDSGPGFNGPAALAQAMGAQPRHGGLALVADEALSVTFDPPGNRVRVWVGD